MLNIGLIGKTASIEKQIEKLKKYPDIMIQGKSSTGTKNQSSDYTYSIPEYNRVELIERSDAIILEDSTLIPYTLIKDSIKRRKHFFFSEYPDFNEDQCDELLKLIEEAGTVVQVKNSLYYMPHVQYLVNAISHPFYLNIELTKPLPVANNPVLWDIFILLLKMDMDIPKKSRTVFIGHHENLYGFRNIRFEYPDSSILELNIIYSDSEEKFTIKAISANDILELNLVSNHISGKAGPVSFKNVDVVKEYESFFKSIIKKQLPLTGIGEYLAVHKIIDEINSKINIASL
jgi:hypothetical protein